MKEKDLDKDTIVAYHVYLQNRIHRELNSVGLGPGSFPCHMALIMLICSGASLLTGILVITLRHRHVYLVDWWHAFVGPFFIILALLCASAATYLIITAKRRSNQYRRELFFRPIGDYGVAVVHKSTLMHEHEHRSDLKSGTTPHRTVMPRAEAFSSHRDRHHKGHENRGYNDNGHDDSRRRHDRDHRERRPHEGERRRHDDHGERRRPDDRGERRRPDDRGERRRPDDRGERRRPDDRDDRRRPPDDRQRHPDDRQDDRRRREDRERGDPEKRQPPPDEHREEPDRETHAPSQGGRRAVRGIPKLADSSKDRVVLDVDFGKPADDESEL